MNIYEAGGFFVRSLNRRKSFGRCLFRLTSTPMRFPPQAVMGGSSPCTPEPGDFSRGCRPAFAENDPLDHFPGASAPGDVHAAACGSNDPPGKAGDFSYAGTALESSLAPSQAQIRSFNCVRLLCAFGDFFLFSFLLATIGLLVSILLPIMCYSLPIIGLSIDLFLLSS